MNIEGIIPGNLYKYCKHNFVDESLLNTHFKHYEKRLGALPYDWLKHHNPARYAKITDKVDQLFSNFSLHTPPNNQVEAYFNPLYEKLVKNLSKILHRQDIKAEYTGCGGYKFCHKITVGNYDYALSTFNNFGSLERDTIRGSGAMLEPSRIFNFYKNYSHGRVAKPFMARFVNDSRAKEYDAYILTKFINKESPVKKTTLPEYQRDFYKYKMVDFNDGNIINGIIVDIGRIEKTKTPIKSSEFRQNLFNFLGIIERNYKENYDNPLFKKIKGGKAKEIEFAIENAEKFTEILMQEGYDIYHADMRDFVKDLTPLEQKYVIRKVRELRKAHNLKLKCQQAGNYDRYKELFENYAITKSTNTLKLELLG